MTAPPVIGGGIVTGPTRAVTPPRTVVIKVVCAPRANCNGTVQLKRGTTVVGRTTVHLRAGRSVKVRVKLLAQASISAVSAKQKRVTASAPRGTRVSFV